MAHDAENTTRLIARAIAGDQAAWDILYHRHTPEIRRHVARLLGARTRRVDEVEDVLQEGWLAAWRRFPEYLKISRRSFRVWRWGLTKQALWDHLRRRHARKRGGDRVQSLTDDVADSSGRDIPHQSAARNERIKRLRDAMERLEPSDREIITLHFFEGHSFGEIGLEMGITGDAAKKRYHRARGRLVTVIAGMPGGVEDWTA